MAASAATLSLDLREIYCRAPNHAGDAPPGDHYCDQRDIEFTIEGAARLWMLHDPRRQAHRRAPLRIATDLVDEHLTEAGALDRVNGDRSSRRRMFPWASTR